MLNHITTIASAIATSCAAPGIMHPRGLVEKKQRSSGPPILSPFHALGQRFWDGSITAEVPKEYLRSSFGCTQFIVSQVNPHITPVLQLQKQCEDYDLLNNSNIAPSSSSSGTNSDRRRSTLVSSLASNNISNTSSRQEEPAGEEHRHEDLLRGESELRRRRGPSSSRLAASAASRPRPTTTFKAGEAFLREKKLEETKDADNLSPKQQEYKNTVLGGDHTSGSSNNTSTIGDRTRSSISTTSSKNKTKEKASTVDSNTTGELQKRRGVCGFCWNHCRRRMYSHYLRTQRIQVAVFSDLQERTGVLAENNLVPSFFGRHVRGMVAAGRQRWSETGEGITIFPLPEDAIGFAASVKEAVTNPDIEDMERYYRIGDRMARHRTTDLKRLLEAEYSLARAMSRLSSL
ncbi:unnamed protein product [Amoebophrya sp. A25]|nr:unnamed protein product [Amoebophrya sp. A25]|eukprot:GSA25T00014982001.1